MRSFNAVNSCLQGLDMTTYKVGLFQCTETILVVCWCHSWYHQWTISVPAELERFAGFKSALNHWCSYLHRYASTFI